MHDLINFGISNYHLFFWVAQTADGAVDSGSSDTFKVALVTTGGVVIAAFFGLLGVTFNRDKKQPAPLPAPDDDDDSLAAELTRRALVAESQCTEQLRLINEQLKEIKVLRDYLWEHGINPYTLKAIGDSSATA